MIAEQKTIRAMHSDEAIRSAFPGDLYESWGDVCRRLVGAGYGDVVTDSYLRHSPELARLASPQAAIALAAIVSGLAIRAGRRAASLAPVAAIVAAKRYNDAASLQEWLRLIEQVGDQAPESAGALLDQTASLTARLDVRALASWIRIGLRSNNGEPERRLRFFTLEDPNARRWLLRESGEVGFLDLEARLKPYLAALWGETPPMRETPANAPEQARRRPGFDGSVVRLPAAYPGFSGSDSEKLYRAAVAHIGAHLKFSRERFPVGALKPAQIALVSLIEDARVEQLAMRELPGLRRLFTPFHVAEASGTATAPGLFARLARALADPAHDDPDPWVQKGRRAFFEAETDWGSQQISRRIGDLLGNDLGQMRVQFDPKNYVVQPPYRDDNLGLWDFGDDDQQQSSEAEQVLSSARIRQEQDDSRPPDRTETEMGDTGGRVEVIEQAQDGVLVARYPEYDYVAARDQPEWTSVKEYAPKAVANGPAARLAEEHADLVARVAALIRSARVSRAERLRRQPEGEFLDMDACIEATVARRIGEAADHRIHGRYERRSRDLSVLLLLDISQSTAEKVRGSTRTVLDVERQSAALLARAMAGLGDPFAIAAFCSDKRDDVRYLRIKDFNRGYDGLVDARLDGLESGLSTRIGAAMRHAGADLARERSYRRLLLVVTDGEPSDIDVEDRQYLVEDARKAVHHLNRFGIDTFCVGLDSNADSYLGRIFGQRNAITIAAVERLTDLLPKLYLTLSR